MVTLYSKYSRALPFQNLCAVECNGHHQLYVNIYIYRYVLVCVCAWVWVWVWVYVCVCVFVCVRVYIYNLWAVECNGHHQLVLAGYL